MLSFSPVVRGWFLDAFRAPTPVQRQTWEAVASGSNVLVVAPTGSGKTLAAFLSAIDQLFQEKMVLASNASPKRRKKNRGVKTLYVSPLKALGADVERNLRQPLAGITQRMDAACQLGGSSEGAVMDGALGDVGFPGCTQGFSASCTAPEITVAQRTGDTTPDQRRKLVSSPPDILITTPESLYLMLTSQAREILRTVETVIVDEVHAMAGNKRGAHLSLSLERLDALLEKPAQRIGLSATVEPVAAVAQFLGGQHPVAVVQEEGVPQFDVSIQVPVADMTAIPVFGGTPSGRTHRLSEKGFGPRRAPVETAWKSDRALRAVMNDSSLPASPDSRVGSSTIWPYLESDILDEVLAHRSTIVFVNSRGLCEKLTARLNELYARRYGGAVAVFVDAGYWSAVGSADSKGPRTAEMPVMASSDVGAQAYRSDMGSSTELVHGAPEVVAKAHHGSVSKEKRREVEEALKEGRLPCVVATSSLELGIDMGDVDLVLQVAAPPSVASGLQRIGRANHQVGGMSQGIFLPRTRNEVVDVTVVADGMQNGRIESTRMVENPLDVLAQQTVAAVAMEDMTADEWFAVVCRSANFARLPRSSFDDVLAMLAGDYTEGVLAKVPPRIVWDRKTGALKTAQGAQRAAVGAAGTIPDRGMFSVVLSQGDGAKGRKRVGELDEEMVMESRVGDIITLGTSTWKIREITADRVVVDPAPGRSARLPFWHGEALSRPYDAGRAKGRFLRKAEDALAASSGKDADALNARLISIGLDEYARQNLVALLEAQKSATGCLPTDRTLVVECCEDETGETRIMLLSPYGRAVHEPWALAISARIESWGRFSPQVMAGDDGIVIQWPVALGDLPDASLFAFSPEEALAMVCSSVEGTSLFAARFRECAARALLMPPAQSGKRAPLWLQRLKGGQLLEAARQEPNFPMVMEAMRECLQDVFDIGSFCQLMEQVESGEVKLVEARTAVPSPFASALVFGYVAEHLYEGDLPHAEKASSLLSVDPALLGELLGTAEIGHLLDPAIVAEVEAQLQHTAPGWRKRGAEGVVVLLRELGPLSPSDLVERLELEGSDADTELCENGERAASDAPSAFSAAPEQLLQVKELLEALEAQHRVFPVEMEGRSLWAFAADGPRLAQLIDAEVPEWVTGEGDARSGERGKTQNLLDAWVRRFASTHGPFSTKDVCVNLGVGAAFVQESVARLQAAGAVVPLEYGSPPQAMWADSRVLARLRRLSADAVAQAAAPVAAAAYQRYVLHRQHVEDRNAQLSSVDAVAEVVAQFEGAAFPFELWDKVVFPNRINGWDGAALTQLIADGEVVWSACSIGQDGGQRAVSFFPTDSALAPLPLYSGIGDAPFIEGMELRGTTDSSSEAPAIERGVVHVLSTAGPLSLTQMKAAIRGTLAQDVASQEIVACIDKLVAKGSLTAQSLDYLRAASGVGKAMPEACARSIELPKPRRATSRRGRSGYRAMERQFKADFLAQRAARDAHDSAYNGPWVLLEPPEADPALQAVGLVESLIDRYGVVTPDIALAAGIPGGLSDLYPILKSMEEAGELLRGRFVEGLGPVQFAPREEVEALRSPDQGASSGDILVLPVEDPALLFGCGLSWPSPSEDAWRDDGGVVFEEEDKGTLRVSLAKRPGSIVALRDGVPMVFASLRLKTLVVFSGSRQDVLEAVKALCGFEVGRLKSEGNITKAKLLVETINGQGSLEPGPSQLLTEAGFVRHPDGMRYYPQLF